MKESNDSNDSNDDDSSMPRSCKRKLNYDCDDNRKKDNNRSFHIIKIRQILNSKINTYSENIQDLEKELVNLRKIVNVYSNIHTQLTNLVTNIDNTLREFDIDPEDNQNINNMLHDNQYYSQLLSTEYSNTSNNIINKQTELDSIHRKKMLCKSLLLVDFNNCNYLTDFPTYNCRICFDNCSFGFKLDCGHSFHVDCLLTSYLENKKCPLCRQSFSLL